MNCVKTMARSPAAQWEKALDPDAELLDSDEGNGEEPEAEPKPKVTRRKTKEVAS